LNKRPGETDENIQVHDRHPRTGNSEAEAVLSHMSDLLEMIAVRRPAYSDDQYAWIDKWIMTLPGAEMDLYDNVVVVVGESRTMFSCHTDTVHYDEKPQFIHVKNGYLYALGEDGKQCVLGADDTAGCWIMRRMILAGVPGTYVFHQAEESGCRGASEFVKENKESLKNYNRIIAFDRQGTGDVIDVQFGDTCCSEEFAEALSDALNMFDFAYKPATGVFTDTAEYTEDVPECTNISVGYYNQHTSFEILDVLHLAKLYLACVGLPWEDLPTVRVPVKDSRWSWRNGDDYVYEFGGNGKGTKGYQTYSLAKYDYNDWGGYKESEYNYDRKRARSDADYWWTSLDKIAESFEELVEMVEQNPTAAAMVISDALGLRI
jgi:hypothetical protein